MAIIPCVNKRELIGIENVFTTLHSRSNEEAQMILAAVKTNLPLTVIDDKIDANLFRKRIKPVLERFLIDGDSVD